MLNCSNHLIPAEAFCLNDTDSNDCELHFLADLKKDSFNYFKLAPLSEDDPPNSG